MFAELGYSAVVFQVVSHAVDNESFVLLPVDIILSGEWVQWKGRKDFRGELVEGIGKLAVLLPVDSVVSLIVSLISALREKTTLLALIQLNKQLGLLSFVEVT